MKICVKSAALWRRCNFVWNKKKMVHMLALVFKFRFSFELNSLSKEYRQSKNDCSDAACVIKFD